MKNNTFYTVIMAGGKGERFWPKSRTKTPKQLLSITGEKTMIQETVARMRKIVPAENIFIITNDVQQKEVIRQLPVLPTPNIVAEPCGRNTAACIGYAALIIKHKDPEGVMVVLPSDHVIKKQPAFLRTIRASVTIAKKTGTLITIGIVPTYPATGYGYIEIGEKIYGNKNVPFSRASSFKEKPDKKAALSYVKSKRYLWNSGMFVFKAETILKEIEKHMPHLHARLLDLQKALTKKDAKKIKRIYRSMHNISIDYAVMEKSNNVLVTPGNFDWDDVGSWNALSRHLKTDLNGNIKAGTIEAVDTRNCIILGEKDSIIATVGLSGLIIVKQKDALLICERKDDQRVKDIVSKLKQKASYKKYL